jgi:hypothetical protein
MSRPEGESFRISKEQWMHDRSIAKSLIRMMPFTQWRNHDQS